MNRKRYCLVYQAGIANVFEVVSFNLSDYGRDAKRIMQSDFRDCETFCRGLIQASALVKSAGCNQAGDITNSHWTEDLNSLPFSEHFNPI